MELGSALRLVRDEINLQQEAVERAIKHWKDAKSAGEERPGQIYGRWMVANAWHLMENVQQARSYLSAFDINQAIGVLTAALSAFCSALNVTEADLRDARHAAVYRVGAITGARAAQRFGGPPVLASTASTTTTVRDTYDSDFPYDSDDPYDAESIEVDDMTIIFKSSHREVRLHAEVTRLAVITLARSTIVCIDDLLESRARQS